MEDRGPRPLFFLLLYLSYVTPTAIGLLLDRTDIVAPMVDRWPEHGRGLMEEEGGGGGGGGGSSPLLHRQGSCLSK